MISRCASAALMIGLLASSVVAGAQNCRIGVYSDPEGLWSGLDLDPGAQLWEFSVYVVLSTEDTVASVAYKFSASGLGVNIFIQNRISGPDGFGVAMDEDPAYAGTRVDFAECAIGIGDQPVLVDEYVIAALPGIWIYFTVEPNTNQHPTNPVYASCDGVQQTCMIGPTLVPVSVEPASMSAIKSLYH